MTNIHAETVARAMRSIAQKLLDAEIVSNEGFSVLHREATRISLRRTALNWDLEIDRGEPVRFEWCKDKNNNDVRPSLIAKFLIDQAHPIFPPFQSLEIAIELHDLEDDPVARWHVDRANAAEHVQAGPLYHLQYGGHHAGLRAFDPVLKEPRWSHPPLEVGLLCEIVAANFFTSKWEEFLRHDAAWCDSIRVFQRLCYSSYVEQMARSLTTSHSTALATMWTDTWHP